MICSEALVLMLSLLVYIPRGVQLEECLYWLSQSVSCS
ncbi:hypothetical protein VIC_002783 [Vibrio coralliilyticus ATCC BAA-450]|nr:hypothetical protein VIC_002783 [Vibrio coralliilyticus ATCC BAA-450]